MAREKGRATPARLVDSGRDLPMVDRLADREDLGGGERPAGLTIGADLGVDRGSLIGVERRGEKFISQIESAKRDDFNGFGEPVEVPSSSSKVRFRFPA